jgi:hypothetical protein
MTHFYRSTEITGGARLGVAYLPRAFHSRLALMIRRSVLGSAMPGRRGDHLRPLVASTSGYARHQAEGRRDATGAALHMSTEPVSRPSPRLFAAPFHRSTIKRIRAPIETGFRIHCLRLISTWLAAQHSGLDCESAQLMRAFTPCPRTLDGSATFDDTTFIEWTGDNRNPVIWESHSSRCGGRQRHSVAYLPGR